MGAIAKVTNEVEGLAYESFDLVYRDEFSQNHSVSSNVDGDLPQDVVDPRVTNIYAPYKLQTPSKVTASFAYVLEPLV
jgi:hypothetical protein